MRAMIKYTSNIEGECASDINLDLIKNDKEKFFIKWTMFIQNTITELKQCWINFDGFLTYYILNKETVFNNFFINYLSSLTSSITMYIAKLIANDDKLTLLKYNCYCENNDYIFIDNVTDVTRSNSKLIKELRKIYEQKVYKVRNKLYGHSDSEILDIGLIDSYLNNINTKDIEQIIKIMEEIVSKIWYAYNHKKMCFELEGKMQYEILIKLIKKYDEK